MRGTPNADFIDPRGGRDNVRGGSGADRIKAFDGRIDSIACGPGRDIVAADLGDRVSADCETVSRRVALDRLSNPDSRHATIVEPDSFGYGSSMVAVYQVGRTAPPGGAAAAIGFATTLNGGRTWRSGLLPALTTANRPRGPWGRASDPVVGYDAAHGVWLASSLALDQGESALTFHRSSDGIQWDEPIVATRSTARDLLLDKQWFACDNWPSSPFYGRCYLTYSDFRTRRISVQVSSDGGSTWSEPIGAPDNAGRAVLERGSPGVQPVVRPNGDLLVLYYDNDQMSLIRSTDGGLTLSRTQFVSRASATGVPRFRSFALPTADVDAAGNVYLSWLDCSFRPGCDGGDLVLARSADGVAWTGPARIPLGARTTGTYYALPGIVADAARAGRLALAYYRVLSTGAIDAFFTRSENGGRSWTRPRRLSPESMDRSWLAPSQYGPMIGDYISTSFVDGRPIPVIVLASPPRGARLDQSLFFARP